MEQTISRRTAIRRRCRATLVVLLLAIVALLGTGCSEDMKQGGPYQIPYPPPDAAPWFLDVWGSGANDVYAVGRPGLLLHFDGSAWEALPAGDDTLTAVWGTGADDVYVTGFDGLLKHFDGVRWTTQSTGTGENLYAVGRGPYDHLYAVGQNGTLLQQAGTDWQPTQPWAFRYGSDGTPIDTLKFWEDVSTFTVVGPYSIGGSSALVLMANDNPDYDHQWLWGQIEDPHRNTLTAAFCSEVVADNYLGNRAGELFQLQGAGGEYIWNHTRDPEGNPSYPATYPDGITGIWVQDADWLWVTSQSGKIARWRRDGTASDIVYSAPGQAPLSGIWGAAPDDIWAVGYEGLVLHYDGATWQRVEVPLPSATAR